MLQELNTDFETIYLSLRRKENRICTDEEVLHLPSVASRHPHFKEWQVRKRSMHRLINWIKTKKKTISILEVGCGNGWLSAQLATTDNTEVTGTDINRLELSQARRVFGNKKNLHFTSEHISQLGDQKFDIILFAASIQYFESLKDILITSLLHLNEGGEIHILDTYFYEEWETGTASRRSKIYYQSLGYENMSNFYFHHSKDELKDFNHRFLFDPSSLKNKLFNKQDPFPWICVKA